jgi:hypothetical protein
MMAMVREKSWSSLWAQSKELEVLVAAGLVDGLETATAQIFA